MIDPVEYCPLKDPLQGFESLRLQMFDFPRPVWQEEWLKNEFSFKILRAWGNDGNEWLDFLVFSDKDDKP